MMSGRMTVRTEKLVLAASLSLLLFAGCKPTTEEAVLSPTENPVAAEPYRTGLSANIVQANESYTPVANDFWVALPVQLQLPGLANVEAARSWNERIAQFPAADKAFLADVNKRYFGSLEFQSEEEQRRLIQQGFPMPEEWLAARNLLDTELERLAQEGNLTAQMFWINRVGEKIGPILGAGEGLGNSPADKELFRRFTEARLMADDLLRSTKSPFAAYLSGRIASAGSFGNPPGLVAGSFQLAKELGDDRADDYMRRFSEEHPGMDANTVMTSYSAMKTAADL